MVKVSYWTYRFYALRIQGHHGENNCFHYLISRVKVLNYVRQFPHSLLFIMDTKPAH